MFFFGAVSSIFVGGNDIFEVMIRLNLFYLAVLVLGLNIWTTNDNALYTAGLGLANIFHQKKKPMVLISGVIGTVASVWLYYNFCDWLNILNCTLPPVGIIVVMDYFMNKKDYQGENSGFKVVNWFSVAGVVLGAVVANVLKWGIASINGMAGWRCMLHDRTAAAWGMCRAGCLCQNAQREMPVYGDQDLLFQLQGALL